jgi:hypothetical protein
MSVSGISSSSLANYNNPGVQNASVWQQQFQQLEQELQSGQLSTAAQSSATSEFGALPAPASQPAPASSSPVASLTTPAFPQSTLNPQPIGPAQWQNTESGGGAHSHIRHHFRIDSGDEDTTTQSPDQLAQLGQTLQSATSSTAQQAYSSFQQIALNADLITAQSAAWQPASGSVSISA